ncbi:endonuclease domain-containing 1 protein-like [Alligator sinensis]|uniref:Endonuclease domain-containing 1 protein-like n=1 Tax=Alligator sinensis TaxID=38654 RepID=A0A1U7SVZ4_ALLSI|nr:endonuclease domain-containing 1 protein-like [Alligator sinensis]
MGSLVLLGLALLWAGLALAAVVPDFSLCNEYFYGGVVPQGLDTPNTANICQKLESKYHFATLYDKSWRIPVWAAYKLGTRKGQVQCEGKWKVEPQLSKAEDASLENIQRMTEEKKLNLKDPSVLKKSQAILQDYEKTGYDQGHLNPNSYQCGKGHREATYTLTNAVPMHPEFNRKIWYALERNLNKQLKDKCINVKGTPFLVTGVVPNTNLKIPDKVEDQKKNIQRDDARVVVPSHVWTAVCCDHSDNNKKFSFAFLGENKPNSNLEHLSVAELSTKLRQLYGFANTHAVKIFKDDCNAGSAEAQNIASAIEAELHKAALKREGDDSSHTLPPPKKPKDVQG